MKSQVLVSFGLTALLLPLQDTVSFAQVSLKETARRNGGRAVISSDVNIPIVSIADLVKGADTIVHARIASEVSRLSSDERMVFTDYELVPFRFFREAFQIQSRAPTGLNPLIMRLPIGLITVDGLELGWDSSAYPQPWLREGDEIVVFLKYDTARAVYVPYYGPSAIFRVTNGRVNALTEGVANYRGDKETDLPTFSAELQRSLEGK